jgi:hypothetical protein
MTLADSEDRSPLWTVGVLCALRDQGQYSDEEIATKLGFDGVEAMQIQLKNWKLPDWLIGEEKSATSRASRKKSGRERRARSSGPVVALPPADSAAPLFREKLEALTLAVEELKHRKEKLQGERFVQSSVSGNLVSDEQRQTIRELLDLDEGAEDYMQFGGASFKLGGGTPAPQDPLPALIGAYLLAGGAVQPLVEALHPDPASADWTGIEKRIEGRKGGPEKLDGLKALAEQLAKAIRGGTLRAGSPGAELSPDEINLASRITKDQEAGLPDEQIDEKVRRLNRSGDELTWEEYYRLADLGLRFPWS